MKHIACVVVMLAACTDFESIDRGACGNGLLEAGEDCDSSEPSCSSCSVTCTTVADCPSTAYACGVDRLCHAPGGALGLPQSGGTFEADDLAVSDINHDGIGDALGLSRTSVLVRSGNAAGQLDDGVSFVTPTQTGPAAFGDLDNDGAIDVTLTTSDGMVSFSSAFGELAPLAVTERLIDEVTQKPFDLRKVYFLATNLFSGVVIDPASGASVLVSSDPSAAPDDAFVFNLPCAARIGAISGTLFDTAKFDVYNVSKRADNTIDAVVAITAGTGASRKFCVVSIHRDAPNLFTGVSPAITYTDITPTGLVPSALPVLADMDINADPCPGIVIADNGLDELTFWDGEMQGGKCAMLPPAASGPQNPLPLPAMPVPPNTMVIGRAPVEPKAPFISSDALITNEGVYPSVFGYYWFNVYNTSRKITHFGTGDIDGDGQVDMAFAAEGEEDIDVLFRVDGQAGFNLYRVDTSTGVKTLTIGDYDANRIDDIAYTEVLDDYVRLLVAYGTPDRPLAPQRVAAFSGVLAVERVSFSDSVDNLGIAEDLLVFQPPRAAGMERRATILHGSPQRTLLSYFDPRREGQQTDNVFRGSVIGDFTSDAGSTQYTDLIAIAPSKTASAVLAWRVPGTADGLDGTATEGTMTQGLADCSVVTSSSGLCLDVSRYLAFPTGPDHDVVIGVDRSRRAVMVDPWTTSNSVSSTALSVLAAKIPANTIPKSLYAADILGDEYPELLVSMAPQRGTGAAGAVISCTMSSTGVPDSCEDLAEVVMAAASTAGIALTGCYDATVARLSYRDPSTIAGTTSDVLVACRGEGSSIFRVQSTDAGHVVERVATLAGAVTSLRAGDVTGDGIDDLIVVVGDVVRSLVVFPQCTNRNTTCLEAGN